MTMNGDFIMPMAKRQKIDERQREPCQSSRLFAPFRTIGLVSPTSVPFTSVPLGKTTFQISTSVGRSLQTYDLRRGLSLVFLTRPQCPNNITAIHAYRDRVFAAWGNGKVDGARGIWVMKRGRLVGELAIENTIDQAIEQIVVFGPWIIGCGPRAIEVWKTETYEHYTTIVPLSEQPGPDARILTGELCTLPTFLNKIFVGRIDGGVGVYNVSTGKLVHTLLPHSTDSGRVTALATAPSLGLLAIAYADGNVIIKDVESEEMILQFQQSNSRDTINCISFRSDGAGAGDDGRKDGLMATSSLTSGDITLWDLNRGGKVVGVLRGAHQIIESSQASGINKIEFLHGQPVLISTGLDNSLKSWVFDQTPFSPLPRPLHARSGHAAPVSSLKFLPASSDGSEAAGKWLLSAGQDRSLWGFSLRKDGQSTELSQGNIKAKAKKVGTLGDNSSNVEHLKASPIIGMACSLNRDGGMGAINGPVWTNPKTGNAEEAGMTGWESVVTAHEDDRFARTWSWGRKKAGRWALETGDRQPVSSVAVTTCGTFAMVGSSKGCLDMFNLQSGIHRQRFPPRLKPSEAKSMKLYQARTGETPLIQRGHTNAITSIVVDNLNQTVISTGLDGAVIFWDFVTGSILHKTSFESASPTAMRYNSISGLVSIACDDLCVRVLDIETKRVVRELWGCVGQIYDHCFSHDGRWIVACSMDSIVRVFDLATGHLIDAFKVPTCTNVAFSSTGEFLATAHAGTIGINIWNNKSLFTHVNTRQINEETGVIDLTSSSDFDAVSQLAIQQDPSNEDLDMDTLENGSGIEQLDKKLLTLSLVPQSRWQTILNLDSIRERNKPIQPPEKPKAAPFFLGTASLANGTQQALETPSSSLPSKDLVVVPQVAEEERSRISRLSSLATSTNTMSTYLDDFKSDPTNPSHIITYLTALSPSATDLQIRSLTMSDLPIFISSLTARLRQRRDFELVNTWMAVVLRVHSEFIVEVPTIRQKVLEYSDVMKEESERLDALVGMVRGTVGFLRSVR